MLMQIWQDAINYTAMPISVLTSYLNCADLSCNVTPIHCSNTPQKRFISSVGPWRSVQLLASTQSRDIDQKLLTNERTNAQRRNQIMSSPFVPPPPNSFIFRAVVFFFT